MDDLFPADSHRHEMPFLTRALEAVIRLVEIYAAEQGIHMDPENVCRLVRAAAHTAPVRSADATTATAPADSPFAEPARVPEDSPPSHEPNERGNTAPRSPRGGWAWGSSTSARIRAEAVEYLRQKGARAKGREIWEAIQKKGVVVNTKDPIRLVSSRIGRSPLFDHTYEGYGLIEWAGDAIA